MQEVVQEVKTPSSRWDGGREGWVLALLRTCGFAVCHHNSLAPELLKAYTRHTAFFFFPLLLLSRVSACLPAACTVGLKK